MDAQVFSVFAQELIKEAVTVEDLYRGVSSAKNVDLDPGWLDKPILNQQGGAMAIGTSRQLRPALAQAPQNVSIDKLQNFLKRAPLQAVKDQAAKLDNLKATSAGIPEHVRGKILINPEGINTILPAISGRPKLQAPEAQKALTALTASHELAERRVNPKNIQRFQSHLAPEVLLKERNALARLEGPGAREAVGVLAAAREQTGEAQQMRNLLTNAYGPRASQFLEGDQKVPKAMLRNLRRRLQANPALLDEADPVKSMGLLDKARKVKTDFARSMRVLDAIKSLS